MHCSRKKASRKTAIPDEAIAPQNTDLGAAVGPIPNHHRTKSMPDNITLAERPLDRAAELTE